MCNNEFDLEGLICVTGKFLRPGLKDPYRHVTHPELFHQIIDAYEKVLPNLKKHASGWHEPDYLRSIVSTGQPDYGIQSTGEGLSSPGSELIFKALEKNDERPIWVVINAGSNTLAQALKDYEKAHSPYEVLKAVSKLRVYENGAQDNAGAWICQHFPTIQWIRSNYQTYAYGGPGGRNGDSFSNLGPHFWGNFENSTIGQNDWLVENVMTNHGPLGEVYPPRRFKNEGMAYMEGGGTMPWIGLVNKGLFDINHPSWGGWGGRFSEKKVADFWSRHIDIYEDEMKNTPFYVHREVSDVWFNPQDGKTYEGDYVPVWRWREGMYNDFKCRMDWCVKPYSEANHHPHAVFNGDDTDNIIYLNTLPGKQIVLDASQSSDPDGDGLEFSWWIYQEAGTYPGTVYIDQPKESKTWLNIPSGAASKQIHLILEIKDKSSIAPLFDYRRVVINVSNVYDHSDVAQQKGFN